MTVTKHVKDESVVFEFIEGDPRNKAAHAFPLRIEVEVVSKDRGLVSVIEVEAVKHGLVVNRSSRKDAVRWAQLVEQDAEPQIRPRW